MRCAMLLLYAAAYAQAELCTTYTCTSSGNRLRAYASTITCPGVPSVCTDALCCSKCAGVNKAVCVTTPTCLWDTAWGPGVCVEDPCIGMSNADACVLLEMRRPEEICSYYCSLRPCVWNGRCETRPCLHVSDEACNADPDCTWMPARGLGNSCLRDACKPLDKAKCLATAGCTYSASTGCRITGCRTHANSPLCIQAVDPVCRWDTLTHQCTDYPCVNKDVTQCAGDSGCLWNGTSSNCVAKTCDAYNDPSDRFSCEKDPDCTWHHGSVRSFCTNQAYGECPDLDVALVLDGSALMLRSFAAHHPHGFYALLEIMRGWVRTLPLTGGNHLVGANAAKGTGEFRLTFLQFGRATPVYLHSTGCAAGACTNGRLSGQLSELEGDITYLANHPAGAWWLTYLHAALQNIADFAYLPTMSAAWRRHVVLIVTASVVMDFDGECGGPTCKDKSYTTKYLDALTAAQDQLRFENVIVFGVVVRRSARHDAQAQAAEQKLKRVVSSPPEEHVSNVLLDELAGEVLTTLCNPNSKFGRVLADPRAGCQGSSDKASCEADAACAWRDAAQKPQCYDDPCYPISDEATCNRDALCLWNAIVCEMKPSCNGHTTQATCEGAGQLWQPTWSAAARCECDPCRPHTGEADCVGQRVTMPGPCTPPRGQPDFCKLPVCGFDATSNTCSKLKCLHVHPSECVKEADCVWTPATPTPGQPAAQVGQCAPPVCTTLPHTCSVGFKLKPAASTTTCPGTPSACDDATCCVAAPVCTTHTCGAGFQLKAAASATTCTSPCDDATCCVADKLCSAHTCTSSGTRLKASASSITCPGVPSVCTDALCCDVLCSTHTCSAGLVDKAAKATLPCGNTRAACTDALCCDVLCSTHTCAGRFVDKPAKAMLPCRSVCTDATCCDVLCSTHTCPSGFQLKPTASTTACPGTPSACDDATCCVADKLCSAHTCTSSGTKLKVSASSITCPGVPSVCTDALCCQRLCSTHACSGAFRDKAAKATLPCDTLSVCTDETCCDVLCSTHTCPSGFQLKPTASTTTCPGTPSFCDDATCCVADKVCSTHVCTLGFLRASASSITCPGTPSVCDDATCCERWCITHICESASFMDKPGKPTLPCGSLTVCTDETCCDVVCSAHTCSVGFQLKPAAYGIRCSGTPSSCDDATCCVAGKLCSTHTCPSGTQRKASASSITCPGVPSVCTDALCCDVLCSTHACSGAFRDKPSKATLPCGSTRAACDDETCCDAKFVCVEHTCGTGFVADADKGNTSCGAQPCADEACCVAAVREPSEPTSAPADEQTAAGERNTAGLVGGMASGGGAAVASIGGVRGASGLGRGGARLARTMVYLSMMDCPRSGVEEVGFVLSPTRLSLGGDDLRELRGAVVGNLALLGLVVVLLVGAAGLRGGRFLVGLGRMPLALPVFLLELLWMPVVQGGFAFVLYSESGAAVGAAVLACAFLFLVGAGLLARKARLQCTFVPNERERKTGLVWFVTAAGSWESAGVLASVFHGFHPARCWCFVVQLVSMTGLAALAAWNPKTTLLCTMRAGSLVLLPTVWAAVLLKQLPYLRPIENAAEVLVTLCEFVFGILVTLGAGQQNQGLRDAAAVLAVVMTYSMLVKVVVDLCTLAYVLREEHANHGTVCGPPARMCCGAGCAACAALDGSGAGLSEPMFVPCALQDSPGGNESEISLAEIPPRQESFGTCGSEEMIVVM